VREVEDLLHGGAQAEQHEIPCCGAASLQHLDQGGDAGAIDVADGRQVEGQFGRVEQGIEQGAAEIRGSAQIHVPFDFHDLGFSGIANVDFHMRPPEPLGGDEAVSRRGRLIGDCVHHFFDDVGSESARLIAGNGARAYFGFVRSLAMVQQGDFQPVGDSGGIPVR
jgi:hypothetical protein